MQELVQIKKKNNSNFHTCASYEAPSTKDIILKYIDNIPSIRYRELLRLSGMTNGTLEYTVRRLENV
jgi:predicted transcriptional regulator